MGQAEGIVHESVSSAFQGAWKEKLEIWLGKAKQKFKTYSR